MKKPKYSIPEVTDILIKRLVAEGVVVQKYKAQTSKSVYLKLDCGVSNSVRISDHTGYKHLKYLFRVETCHNGGVVTMDGKYRQYLYSSREEHIEVLIQHILAHRARKIQHFGGPKGYRAEMVTQYHYRKGNNRFWRNASFISKKTGGREVKV